MLLNIIRHTGSLKRVEIKSDFALGKQAIEASSLAHSFYKTVEFQQFEEGEWVTKEVKEEHDPVFVGRVLTGTEITEEGLSLSKVMELKSDDEYIVTDYELCSMELKAMSISPDTKHRLTAIHDKFVLYEGQEVVNHAGTVICKRRDY